MKNKLIKLLFPPAVLIIPLSVFCTAALIFILANGYDTHPASFAVYVLSAYTLTVLCMKIPKLVRYAKKIKHENRAISRLSDDVHLRVNISLYGAFLYNAAYSAFQLFLGIYHGSVWFCSMAAYYILLSVMRFLLLRHTNRHRAGENIARELKIYRFCGIMLLIMNLALGVIIFYIVWQNRTFEHHEIVTIALAAYTFSALSLAIANVIKYRRYKSPVFSAAKAVSLTSALVSLLTLETSMFSAFGAETEESLRGIMTALTGAAIDIFILAAAVYMIARATKELTKLKQNLNNS